MTHTRSDLVHEALQNLGFLPEGTVAPAEEYAVVDRRLDDMVAYLETMEIVYLPSPGTLGDANSGQFEDHHFAPLGHILADMVKTKFGQAGDQTISADRVKAEADLYDMEALPYTRKIAESQYF